MPAEALVTVYQVHSADVVVCDAPWRPEESPRADALVTANPAVALGILTADCTPVLFAAPDARVVGAAHAGWRGALVGVLEATVAEMNRLGAENKEIVAVIGPCIAQDSYEVGPEFPQPFLDQDRANERLFRPSDRSGHHQFDLPGYVARRLAALGLAAVHDLACDTAAEEERFFSYRRSVHRGEPDYGRQLSAIALAD